MRGEYRTRDKIFQQEIPNTFGTRDKTVENQP